MEQEPGTQTSSTTEAARHPTEKSEVVEVHAKTLRLWLLVAASFVFVAAGVWIVSIQLGVLATAAGCASVLFFGFCGGWGVLRGIDQRPLLVLDSTGIVDHASITAAGRVSLAEIESITVHSSNGLKMLGIFVTDLDALRNRLPWWKRMGLAMNLLLGFPPVSIPQVLLPVPVETLAELLEARLRDASQFTGE